MAPFPCDRGEETESDAKPRAVGAVSCPLVQPGGYLVQLLRSLTSITGLTKSLAKKYTNDYDLSAHSQKRLLISTHGTD